MEQRIIQLVTYQDLRLHIVHVTRQHLDRHLGHLPEMTYRSKTIVYNMLDIQRHPNFAAQQLVWFGTQLGRDTAPSQQVSASDTR